MEIEERKTSLVISNSIDREIMEEEEEVSEDVFFMLAWIRSNLTRLVDKKARTVVACPAIK